MPRIYIKSDGSVEPATAPIERIGNYYKLKENITRKTIVIQRDNIVLDGSHHLIERNNVNITNLNIERFTTGIRISNSSYINIFGNSFKEETAVFDNPRWHNN
ncbi:MAG: hypothetical protein QW674_01715 [Candidatus Bathyarchaeia archaeon]